MAKLDNAPESGRLSVTALIASATVSTVSTLPSIVLRVAGNVVPVSTSTASTLLSTVATAEAVAKLDNAPESGRLSVTALIPSTTVSTVAIVPGMVVPVSSRIESTTVSTVLSAEAVARLDNAPESGRLSVTALIASATVSTVSIFVSTSSTELVSASPVEAPAAAAGTAPPVV